MKYLKLIYIVSSFFLFTSCEDVITVEVDEGTEQIAVDAFVTNLNETQTISLKKTKQFFGESEQVPALVDSVWIVDDLNNKYVFTDVLNNGNYEWTDSVLVHENRTYNLFIADGDVLYTSQSESNPVPVIDSLNWEYLPASIGDDNGTYGVELVARDIQGRLDYYWVRNYVNGVLKPGINLSVDGSFNDAAELDGNLFIPPISTFSSIDREDSLGLGDTFTYQIWSITEDTYGFWSEISNQEIGGGGIGALFATPTANVKSNIQSNSTDVSETAVGWFSVSLVRSASQLIFEKEGESFSFGTD